MTDKPTLRHPEKARRPDNPSPRKPDWIRVKAPTSAEAAEVRKLMRDKNLHTVCGEAACPNIGECWKHKHATFMILGDTCTRACAFCNVKTGKPGAVDVSEPENVAASVASMGLRHVVITSVDRDDLADGGAFQFVACIERIRATSPATTIEILTPDFRDKDGAIAVVAKARPDVFNHNLETVPRLYPTIRPGARYFHSLRLLRGQEVDPAIFTKSGIMVGLGGSGRSVAGDGRHAFRRGRFHHHRLLQPTLKHAAVDRFVTPDVRRYRATAGPRILMVAATPLTHSCARHAISREREAAPPPTARRNRAGMPTRGKTGAAYTPDQLFDMVADVEKYPEFLPWCVGARIRKRDGDVFFADLVIGFKMIRERYTSKVTLDRAAGRIDVTYTEGPFHYLNNHWAFLPNDDGSTTIDFFVDFEFKSKLLQKLIGTLFNEAVKLMVGAFEKRAGQLHGPDGRRG